MKTDTIAAVATAMSNSGIGIIRVSGDDSILIVDNMFVGKNKDKKLVYLPSHTIHYGFIYDGEELIDEVMVSLMKSPHSYTTEDVVEINCHGGIVVINRILGLVIRGGARYAEPGEFTKRAFLSGRIDLSKAEAIMDIISAKNEYALKSSMSQLKGSLSQMIKELREKIIFEIAFIESALDDPEHISLEGYAEKLENNIKEFKKILEKLLSTAKNGKILKEGIQTVIIGKPNAGKSSLLNLLVGEEKAIVTSIAGTTRDIVEESIQLKGIQLNIVDTAGIRSTEDEVEIIGVKKAKDYAIDADLVVYVVDTSIPLDENDYEIMKMIQDKKCIILLNKSDLEVIVDENILKSKIKELSNNENKVNSFMIKTSTKDKKGIEEFQGALLQMFFEGEISFNEEVFITNMRHKEAIEDTLKSLQLVEQSIQDHMPEDFFAIDLMSAYASLGYIIGEEVGENLINEIFSKFCMGK